jgi:adenine phosphoribosyltransferase
MKSRADALAEYIRDVPDFPKPGIIFKDITPLLASPTGFKNAVDLLVEHYRPMKIDGIMAIESRGFLFGAPLALALQLPLHILRKPGKLPYLTDRVEYALEYGNASLELHRDSLRSGQRVVAIDDLLATGGTACAAAQLATKQGAQVVECGFIIELGFLHGRKKIDPLPCFSLLKY